MKKIDLTSNLIFAKSFYININRYEASKTEDLNFEKQFSLREISSDFEPLAINLLDLKSSDKDLKSCLEDYFNYVEEVKIPKDVYDILENVDLTVVYKLLENSYSTIVMFNDKNSSAVDLLLDKEFKILQDLNFSTEEDKIIYARLTYFDGNFYFIDKIKTCIYDFAILFSDFLKEKFLLDKPQPLENKINILKFNAIAIMLSQIWFRFESAQEELELSDLNSKQFALQEFLGNENLELFDKFLDIAYLKQGIDEDGVYYFFGKFYDLSLSNFDVDFSTIYKVNLEDIFLDIAQKGIVYTEIEFKMFLSLIKLFYQYINTSNNKYDQTLLQIKNIEDNIFVYIEKIRSSKNGFFMEDSLIRLVDENINFEYLNFYNDFLDIVQYSNLKFSKVDGNLTPSSVQLLASQLELSPIKIYKVQKQSHYPTLDFLYNFLMYKDIIKKHYEQIEISNRLSEFHNFKNGFKYILFIESLFSKEFLKTYMTSKKADDILSKFSSVYEKLSISPVPMHEIIDNDEYNFIFDFLFLFEIIYTDGLKVFLSEFGEEILSYFFKNNTNNIIKLKR